MKKLLLSIFTIASVSFSVSSQTVLYNIGEIFTDVENPATSKNDFIVANKSGKVAVENNEKHSDGIIYTKRLKTGGKCSGSSSFENGIPVSCAIGFPVSEDGTIKMVVLAGGTSDVRIIDYTFVSSTGDINTGSTNYITGGIEAEKVTVGDKEYDDIKPFSFDHKGGAGTMYLYSTVNGVNFYGVSFTPSSSTSINDVEMNASVVKTEYFNINGVQVSEPSNGIFIVKKTFDNGTVKAVKEIIK